MMPALPARADRLWTLQLKGGSIVLALDAPEERGASLVFHRHPDGLFSSLRTDEVRRITIAEGPRKKPRKSLDGEILVFGRDAEPPERNARLSASPSDFEADSEENPSEPAALLVVGAPPRHHRPHPHSRIGSNGFPILAPAGSSGFNPPAIGANGFPILSPTPPPFSFQGLPARR